MADGNAERDEEWRRERLHLLVRSTAETEQRTLVANIAGTLLIVGAAQWLPNASDFYLPMLLRFVALFGTALLYENIRRRLDRNDDTLVPLRFATVMAAFAGISWASMILPVFRDPYLHPSSYIVTAGVCIGIALIITSTAAIKRIAIPFAAGFIVTFLAAAAFTPPQTAIWLAGGLFFIMTGIGMYSIGSARQRLEAADMWVQNRRLTEDLEEALARAEFLAIRDPLTGLYNRRDLFEEKIHREAPGKRHHVCAIDLDHFKQVNDRFGHDTGDRVLIAVAAALRDTVRDLPGEGHLAARLGGEEFAVFLDIAEDEQADEVAARLRRAANRAAAATGLPENLGTASIGISPMTRGEGIGNALQRADKALYGAKEDGRNRVRRLAA
ncbi:MAG: diguanylate cyclase [Erythrobacter sp.]